MLSNRSAIAEGRHLLMPIHGPGADGNLRCTNCDLKVKHKHFSKIKLDQCERKRWRRSSTEVKQPEQGKTLLSDDEVREDEMRGHCRPATAGASGKTKKLNSPVRDIGTVPGKASLAVRKNCG